MYLSINFLFLTAAAKQYIQIGYQLIKLVLFTITELLM